LPSKGKTPFKDASNWRGKKKKKKVLRHEVSMKQSVNVGRMASAPGAGTTENTSKTVSRLGITTDLRLGGKISDLATEGFATQSESLTGTEGKGETVRATQDRSKRVSLSSRVEPARLTISGEEYSSIRISKEKLTTLGQD